MDHAMADVPVPQRIIMGVSRGPKMARQLTNVIPMEEVDASTSTTNKLKLVIGVHT